MKMTDVEKFKVLFKNVPVKKYTDPKMIYSDAVDLGAVVAYAIGSTDFNFNKRGKLVGINTESINSFYPNKRIKK